MHSAAHDLNISQPALSDQIQRLEEDLGVVLLVRNSHGVRATDAAKALLPHLRTTLRGEEALRQEASAINGLRSGRLRLGSISGASHGVLQAVVRRTQHEHPSIQFGVTEGLSTNIAAGVITGDFELGVILRTANGQQDARLRYVDLDSGRIVLSVPSASPLAKLRSLQGTDLDGEPMIVHQKGALLREAFDLLTSGVRIHNVYQTNSAETAQRMVTGGIGSCVASTLAPTTLSGPDVKIVPIADSYAWVETRMSVILRRDEQPAPAARYFLHLLREESALRKSTPTPSA